MSERGPEVRAALRRYILEEILHGELDRIRDDEPLVSGGLIDSYYVVRLAVHAEDLFGVRLPDEALAVEGFDTLDEMTDAVVRRLP